MTTRILPPDEWPKVAHTEAGPALPFLDPAKSQIVVLEHEGRVVATWSVLTVVHLEGLWIDPAYRGHAGVARMLFRATWRIVRRLAPKWVMTAAATPDVKALLEKVGAVHVPGEMYVMSPTGEAAICRLQE